MKIQVIKRRRDVETKWPQAPRVGAPYFPALMHFVSPSLRFSVSSRGFNLTELMFSILILGLGLIAVAGLFPMAGTMQKATADQVAAQQVAMSAMAAFRAREVANEISVADVANSGANPWLNDVTADGGIYHSERFETMWSIGDRRQGDFYWVPLFRKDPFQADPQLGWFAYILILRTIGEAPTHPQATPADNNVVLGTTPALTGDFVFDARSDATIEGNPRVMQLTRDYADTETANLWHGATLGTISPTKQFIVFGFEPQP